MVPSMHLNHRTSKTKTRPWRRRAFSKLFLTTTNMKNSLWSPMNEIGLYNHSSLILTTSINTLWIVSFSSFRNRISESENTSMIKNSFCISLLWVKLMIRSFSICPSICQMAMSSCFQAICISSLRLMISAMRLRYSCRRLDWSLHKIVTFDGKTSSKRIEAFTSWSMRNWEQRGLITCKSKSILHLVRKTSWCRWSGSLMQMRKSKTGLSGTWNR